LVIRTNDFFIPIPKPFNTQVQITINGEDRTGRVYDSKFIRPSKIGIGTFFVRLINTGGLLTGRYSKGQDVKFFADYTDKTALKFHGKIDYVKDVIEKEGQFLEIEGRHRSKRLTTIKVNHKASGVDPAQILKDIIDKFASEFTYVNVKATTLTADVDWEYVPFWDCVIELCAKGQADCRVDNDLDFHYHPENSVFNGQDYVAEKINFLKMKDWGRDTFYEITRITVVGTDTKGLPIVYTAINGIDNDLTEDEIIEGPTIQDTSLKTVESVKSLAISLLNADIVERPPQGVMETKGLEYAEPGENIWFVIFRQQIYGIYRIIQIADRFGTNVGLWKAEVTTEREGITTQQLIEQRIRNETRVAKYGNPNKLLYSFNFEFDDDTKTLSHKSTQVAGGVLQLVLSGSPTTGTWISTTLTLPATVSKLEFQRSGKDLSISQVLFSLDDNKYELFTSEKTLQNAVNSGKVLRIKVELKLDALNPQPHLDSLVVLCS